TDEAIAIVKAVNSDEGPGYLDVYDLKRLGPIAKAIDTPSTLQASVTVSVPNEERFITTAGPRRLAVAAIRAQDIVIWPGIDDRTLFDLNIRGEIRPNRVRRELEGAVERAADHPNFVAYHNGLTVVCEKFDEGRDSLTITNLSVVNGAQSVVAFRAKESSLS